MATKYVRCNYFEVVLVPYALVVRQEVQEEGDWVDPFMAATPYDMVGILDYIQSRRLTDLAVQVSEEIAEMELESISHPDGYIRNFQLSKLKDTNIPAKKRIGQVKEDIQLQDDEFIGEFTSVIYDSQLCTLMVQANKYGLTTKEIEVYLTELRWRYLQDRGQEEDAPSVVRLRPILDESQAQRVLDAEYFRKITIRGSTLMEDGLAPDGLMSKATRALRVMV